MRHHMFKQNSFVRDSILIKAFCAGSGVGLVDGVCVSLQQWAMTGTSLLG